MAFDDIINKTDDEKDALIQQALRKQEYNRNYQRRLREVAKLATLERKIDDNLNHVLGYIKSKYSKEYKAWTKPVKTDPLARNVAFDNWVLLSANEYKGIKEAFELSGLKGALSIDQFEDLFRQNYKQKDSGGYIKV